MSAAAFPQRDSDSSRLAALETKHENLRERLYGAYGQKGDIQEIKEDVQDIKTKLDSVVAWQQRCVGAAVLVTVVVPLIEHYWK